MLLRTRCSPLQQLLSRLLSVLFYPSRALTGISLCAARRPSVHQLNGVSDFITVPSTSFGSSFTFVVTARLDSLTPIIRLVSFVGGGGPGTVSVSLSLVPPPGSPPGSPAVAGLFETRDGGMQLSSYALPVPLWSALAAWSQVAVMLTGGMSEVSVFVNGMPAGPPTSIPSIPVQTRTLNIGKGGGPGESWMQGLFSNFQARVRLDCLLQKRASARLR